MLSFVQNIFGMKRRHQRSESQDAISKRKHLIDSQPKRINSIDSKLKYDTVIKPNLSQSFFELDDVNTIKNSRVPSSQKKQSQQLINLQFISDIDDQDENIQYRTDIDSKPRFEKKPEQRQGFQSMILQLSQNLLENLESQQELENQEPTKAIQKYMTKREQEKKMIITKLQCPFCSKKMGFEDSLKLACLHRYHKSCAQRMRARNNYKCDLCEIKHHPVCSIIEMDRRRGRF